MSSSLSIRVAVRVDRILIVLQDTFFRATQQGHGQRKRPTHSRLAFSPIRTTHSGTDGWQILVYTRTLPDTSPEKAQPNQRFPPRPPSARY